MTDGKPKAPSYFHFLAGLATGSISAALLQPADLLKTRVQQSQTSSLSSTLREILSSPNAVAQLWRGTIPSVVRTGLGSAMYFSTLDILRRGFARLTTTLDPAHAEKLGASKMRGSNLGNLLSGAVARTSAGFVLMPVTVIKVRYESNLYRYSSMSQAVSSILRTEGVRGLFAGFGATAIRDAPYAGLYVLFYEQTRRYMKSTISIRPDANFSSSKMATVNFTAGVVAAAAATAITNPFDALKTRIQLMPGKYGNLFKAASQILRQEGVKSLFDGLGLRMARKAASSALSWTLYEEIIRRAEKRVIGVT